METPDGIKLRDFAVDPIKKPDTTATTTDPDPRDSKLSFWSRRVRVLVDEKDCRDHFALERTFLAYVRTASAYAQFGVTMAQLFRLNVSNKGEGTPTSLAIGKALGATTEGIAIVVMLIGAVYFMKKQAGLLRGVFTLTGWDVLSMMTISVVLFCILFGLLIAADRW